MLPGIRFLFATTLLAVSLAICGIGATALLRAAQQNSATLPSLQALRDPFPPASTEPPTLALMRVETPVATDNAATSDEASAANATTPLAPDVASDMLADAFLLPEARDVVAGNTSSAQPSSTPATQQLEITAEDNTTPEKAAPAELSADLPAAVAPVQTTAIESNVVASKPDDTTTPTQTAETASQQTAQPSDVEKTASTSPESDASLATGSLPNPSVKAPDAKPKPIVTKARANTKAKRVVRRVARAAPRPQAAAKQASPFGF